MQNEAGPDVRFTELEPGNHLCCFHQTDEEERFVMASFIRERLGLGEKVVCISDTCMGQDVLHTLCEQGFDSDKYLSKKQLNMLPPEDTYLKGGFFNPDSMIRTLKEAVVGALAEGYSSFAATGNACWALDGGTNYKLLIKYEEDINRFVYSAKCLVLCRYDMRGIDPGLLRGVLETHPLSVNISGIRENTGHFLHGKGKKYFLSLSAEGGSVELKIRGRRALSWDPRIFDGRLKALFNGPKEVWLLVDRGGTVERILVSGDRSCCDYEHKIAGEKIIGILPKSLGSRVMRAIKDVMTKNSVYSNDYELLVDGRALWVKARIIPFGRDKAVVSIVNITYSKHMEAELKEYSAKKEQQDILLRQKDAAIRELFGQIERIKAEMKGSMLGVISESARPVLKTLQTRGKSSECISIIHNALRELPFSGGVNITGLKSNLSPREAEICCLIIIGLKTKAIADLLNLSSGTVEKHRRNVRKKLGLRDKKINLTTHLKSL